MMKFCFVFLFALLVTSAVYSQNKTMGVGTPTPNPNAALHVESPTNNQGFIMPRLTTAQRTAMAAVPLTASDEGLMVYDKDLNVTFVWDGTSWQSPSKSAAKFYITDPASIDTALTATTYSNQPHGFAISGVHKGTGDAAGFFLIDNNNNPNPALYGEHRGQGPAVMGNITTAAGTGFAILGNTSGNEGSGVAGFTSGTNSNGGIFLTSNPANTRPALYGSTQGTGSAILGETSSGNSAIAGLHNGATGNAGLFSITNAGNTSPALLVNNAGTGNAIQTAGKIQAGQFIGDGSLLTNVSASPFTFPFSTPQNTATTTWDVVNSGTGSAGSFSITNPANTAPVLLANTDGTGALLRAISTGTGRGAWFSLNGASAFPALRADTQGTGYAAYFQVTNATSGAPVISTQHLGTGPVLDAWISNTASTGKALWATHDGLGMGLEVNLSNPSNAQPGIKINHLGTGNAIETTGKIQAGQFIGDGSQLTNVASSSFTLPLLQTNTNAGNGVTLLDISTNAAVSTDVTNVAHFQNLNPAAFSNVFKVTNKGTGATAQIISEGDGTGFISNNSSPTNPFAAIRGISAGGIAVQGRNTSSGNGFAGLFENVNGANTYPAIQATTYGTGSAIRAFMEPTAGNGPGIDVFMQKTASTSPGLAINASHAGHSIFAVNSNSSNPSSGIHASTNGTGDGIYSEIDNTTSTNTALKGRAVNTSGGAGAFEIFNASNGFDALYAVTQGTGKAGSFSINNPLNSTDALIASTNGSGNAFSAYTNGTGRAGWFHIQNPASTSSGITIWHQGNGTGLNVDLANTSGFKRGVDVNHQGEQGEAAVFRNTNTANNNAALFVESSGTSGGAQAISASTAGPAYTAILGQSNGTAGHAGKFVVNNAGNGSPALWAESLGNGKAGSFTIANSTSSDAALFSTTNGVGNSLFVTTTNPSNTANALAISQAGTGNGLDSWLPNSSNTGNAVQAATNGTGNALLANHVGASGNIAVFQDNGVNVAWVDKNGNVHGNSFPTTSDRRLKTEIQGITLGLDFILNLKPVTYLMKNQKDTKINMGFIAQEVEELVGKENAIVTVREDKDQTRGLRYTDFIAPMVKAMQEQQNKIEALEKTVAELKQLLLEAKK